MLLVSGGETTHRLYIYIISRAASYAVCKRVPAYCTCALCLAMLLSARNNCDGLSAPWGCLILRTRRARVGPVIIQLLGGQGEIYAHTNVCVVRMRTCQVERDY